MTVIKAALDGCHWTTQTYLTRHREKTSVFLSLTDIDVLKAFCPKHCSDQFYLSCGFYFLTQTVSVHGFSVCVYFNPILLSVIGIVYLLIIPTPERKGLLCLLIKLTFNLVVLYQSINTWNEMKCGILNTFFEWGMCDWQTTNDFDISLLDFCHCPGFLWYLALFISHHTRPTLLYPATLMRRCIIL